MERFWELFTTDEPEHQVPKLMPLCAVEFDPGYVCWGLSDVPLKQAPEHFLSCGTVGSGKTTGIRLFLQSIAPRFQKSHPHKEQLILFDAKGDALPMLDGMGISPKQKDVWILNPFDERGCKWDIGTAIDSPAMARYLASLIIPHEPNSTAPYFNNASRQIVFWVAVTLTKLKPNDWTLRDLINALESKKRIMAVCSRFPRAHAAVSQHCNDSTNFGGVLSTLETKMGQFHEVAALWDTSRSRRKFSIPKFLKSRGVLVLGHDPVLRESIAPMNAIILQALTNEILREPETNLPRHWFVLDEFPAMQRVDCIRSLLNLGRSKGASVLLGLQSVEGLREIYQENAAEDILQACSNKTFLRAGGAVTAKWAEEHFNRIRRTELKTGVSYGPGGRTNSYNYEVQERSLFLASVFLNLPKPSPGGPFNAVNDIPCFKKVLINDWWSDEVFSICKPSSKIPGIRRRNKVADQFLRRWDVKEERDFCNTTSPDTPLKEEKTDLGPTTKRAHKQRRYRH
jgi:type IV secretory pathway TraG/TraD family ATPase VirD4